MSGSNGRVQGSRGRFAPRSVTFTIPSTYASTTQAQQQILAEVEKAGYTEHTLFAIKLALEEALINAVKHGNKLDPAKQVHIDVSLTPQKARFIIEDEGPGFDLSALPDPLAEENLEKPSGRGILLIRNYMNRVRWTNGGRRVEMTKINGKEAGS